MRVEVLIQKFFSFAGFLVIFFAMQSSLFAQPAEFEDPFADFEEEELPADELPLEEPASDDSGWEEPEVIDLEEETGFEETPEAEDFSDPFSDEEEAFEESPFNEEEPQILSPSAEPAPAPPASPSPSTSFPTPPRVDDFYPEEAPPSPTLDRGIRFPEPEPTRGPVTEDIFRSKENAFDRKARPWHISGSIGVAPGIVDRPPGQVNFELGGGYLLWEKWELAGLMSYRVREDRVLSIIVLPAYQANLWTRPNFRVDWRAGAGLGWALRGVQGNDFQFGYLPIRTHASLLLYPAQSFSILLGLDTESFVFETQTGGGTSFLFASQAIFSTGLRFEF